MKKFLLTTLISCSLFGGGITNTYAKEVCITNQGYSSVVSDLENLEKYSSKYISNSQNIFVTLSQGYNENKELKTYIYLNYIGSNNDKLLVNLSTNINENDNSKNYDLNLVSYDTNTNLKKYEIINLNNLSDTTRKYELNSISMNNETIINLDNQKFYFNGTNNDNLECYLQEIETIQITDKEVVNYCYGNSLNFFGKETGMMAYDNIYNDTWFIFFNTDKEINNLYSVELTYTQYDFCIGNYGKVNDIQTSCMDCIYTETFVKDFVNNPPSVYSGSAYNGDFYLNYQNPVTKRIEPGTKKVESTQYGWFGSYKTSYETLDNIMDLKKYQEEDKSAFIFSEYANNYSWGVHFNDTSRTFKQKGSNGVAGLITASGVTDTAILKLTFETNGKVKTLNAIDTPTKSEDNKGDIAENPDDLSIFNSLVKEWKKILKIIAYVFGSIFGIYLLSIIIKYIKKIVKNLKSK